MSSAPSGSILEVYDAMQQAMTVRGPVRDVLDPPPGHGPRHPAKETTS